MADQRYAIFRLTQEAYDQLAQFARENPQAYLNPDTDFEEILSSRGVQDIAEETEFYSTCPIELTPVPERPPQPGRPSSTGLLPLDADHDRPRLLLIA